ncbi:hypothetical protein BN871_AD_00040 [Paenibacillus sp. P22]|nr:hypothetical protein BN871_AD_00040 [Paenibacillus sp. P22]
MRKAGLPLPVYKDMYSAPAERNASQRRKNRIVPSPCPSWLGSTPDAGEVAAPGVLADDRPGKACRPPFAGGEQHRHARSGGGSDLLLPQRVAERLQHLCQSGMPRGVEPLHPVAGRCGPLFLGPDFIGHGEIRQRQIHGLLKGPFGITALQEQAVKGASRRNAGSVVVLMSRRIRDVPGQPHRIEEEDLRLFPAQLAEPALQLIQQPAPGGIRLRAAADDDAGDITGDVAERQIIARAADGKAFDPAFLQQDESRPRIEARMPGHGGAEPLPAHFLVAVAHGFPVPERDRFLFIGVVPSDDHDAFRLLCRPPGRHRFSPAGFLPPAGSLTFDGPDGDAFQEVALQAEEQDEHRQRRDGRARHHRGEVRRIGKAEVLESDLDRLHVHRVGHEERPEERIPRFHERKDGHDGHDGFGQRHDDAGEDLPLAAALHLGALQNFLRYGAHELLGQEDVVDGDQARRDQRRIRVGDVEDVDDEDVQRNLRHLVRNHHSDEQDSEQRLAAPEPDLGEGVARHRGEHDVGRHRHGRDEQGVAQPTVRILAVIEEELVGIERNLLRPQGIADRTRLHRISKGGDEHEVDREQRRQREQQKEEDDDGIADVAKHRVA